MNQLVYPEECYEIIGACFEVYKEKGNGITEGIFQECLELEMEMRGIPFSAQAPLAMSYKERRLRHRFVADFICFDRIVVELKAVEMLVDEHRAQMLNYLHATGLRLGLLVNSGHQPQLEWQRMVR